MLEHAFFIFIFANKPTHTDAIIIIKIAETKRSPTGMIDKLLLQCIQKFPDKNKHQHFLYLSNNIWKFVVNQQHIFVWK